MDKKTYDTLVASCKKWRVNYKNIQDREGKLVSIKLFLYGSLDCPLCELFGEKSCRGCPVFEKTKVTSCQDTPYYEIVNEINRFDYSLHIQVTKKLIQETNREIRFLESLIPQGGPEK